MTVSCSLVLYIEFTVWTEFNTYILQRTKQLITAEDDCLIDIESANYSYRRNVKKSIPALIIIKACFNFIESNYVPTEENDYNIENSIVVIH